MMYAERDARKLEPFYSQHVSAMTAERLHEKSDIAAELAFRDSQLESVTRSRDALLDMLEDAAECLENYEDASMEPGDTGFHPNRAMQQRTAILELIDKTATAQPKP